MKIQLYRMTGRADLAFRVIAETADDRAILGAFTDQAANAGRDLALMSSEYLCGEGTTSFIFGWEPK